MQRIITYATLAISLLTLVLVLRRPSPVAAPAEPAAAAASAQSFQEKLSRLEKPRNGGEDSGEVRLNSDEINAALAQAAAITPPNGSTPRSAASGGAMQFPGPVPSITDYEVSMDGDVVRGQFVTQIAGKDVYLTLAGHLGAKDGYATFDATEVKIGELSIPASLVNDALQKKLAEQRNELKSPTNVKDIRVENGELVFIEK